MPTCQFLGTGPGEPVADRFNSSALLAADEGDWLIDVGEPAAQRLVAHGIGLETLDGAFITHGHADHIGGLPMLIQAMQVGRRSRPLHLIMPHGLADPLRCWLQACCLSQAFLDYELRIGCWEEASHEAGLASGAFLFQVGELQIEALRNTHLKAASERWHSHKSQENRMENDLHPGESASAHPGEPCFDSYSLRIRSKASGWSVIFSSDIAEPDDLHPFQPDFPDLLVVELAHISPADLLRLIEQMRPQRVAITHVAPGRDLELLGLLTGVPKELTPQIILVADGDLITFP